MRTHDIFLLVTRVIGFIVLLSSIAEIVVGLALMRGLIPLANFAFPEAAKEGHREAEQDETLSSDK
jgi:hypothetical protein